MFCLRSIGTHVLMLLVLASASAQTPAPGSEAPLTGSGQRASSAAALGPAEVVVQNRLVAVMRADLLGYPPEARAKGAMQRIHDILSKDGPGIITTEDVPEGRGFSIDGEFAFFLTPRDAHVIAGHTFESTAEKALAALEKIVQERAEQRDPKAMAIAASLAVGATVIFAALLWIILVANRWLRQRGSAALIARARAVKIAGVAAIELGQFLRAVRYLVTALSWVVGGLVTYVWLVFVLERFPYTRAWGENLLDVLLDFAGQFLHAIVNAVPGLLTVIVIFVLARWVIKISAAFFSRVESGRVSMSWLDADTAAPTRRILNVVIWLFALAMAYPYLPGSQTDAFKGLSVLVGLMISIGASNLVGQAASGLILMYARAFRAGEFVSIGETEGTVTELGLFSTRVLTGLGEEVMLPNSLVLSQTAKNYSRASSGEGYLVDTKITIGYSTPWRQVHEMLHEAAKRTRGILTEPAPEVLQTALSDFYVEYRMVCHTNSEAAPRRLETLGELHAHIQDVFNEHDVQTMSPHYMQDPPSAQVVPPAKWYPSPARPPTE